MPFMAMGCHSHSHGVVIGLGSHIRIQNKIGNKERIITVVKTNKNKKIIIGE
jgi:hypothetical protein